MHIQGLDAWVPPVGKVFDVFTQEVVSVPILQKTDIKKDQTWFIDEEEYEEYLVKRKDELSRQKENPAYIEEFCEEYRRENWFNRMNGVWFMNNGKPTYITGLHWFYIRWWRLDTGLPDFRHADLLYFYHLHYCVEDPECIGQLCFAPRRIGKSYRSGAFLFEGISRKKKALGGIQSKNDTDGGEFFMIHVVEPMQTLPDFFMPEYDTKAGKAPRKTIRFFPTNRTGENAESKKALSSWINFKNASEKAYDSKKLVRYSSDEYGKLITQYSLLERHRVVKPCFMIAGKVVGKALYSTTVEDMGGDKSSGVKNIQEVKKLAEDSDPTNRNANGRTPSMLYRFWLPAHECHFFDKYGMPLKEKSLEYFENQFQTYLDNGDYIGWASERRKYPLEYDDVFRVAAKAPIFRVDLIYDRTAMLAWRKEEELYITGNFVWEEGRRDGKVKFVEAPTGRFNVRWKDVYNQSAYRPMNKHKGVIGIDPFEHKASFKPSQGAAYGLKKYDPYAPEFSNSPIFEYCNRPVPNVFFEDMIKVAVFYGWPVLCENNRIGLVNYFRDRGYEDFLIWLPGQVNPGIFAGDKSKQLMAEAIDAYITEHVDKVWFPKLLEDLAIFDLANSTAFDRSMAFGWALVGAGDLISPPKSEQMKEITDYLPIHQA